LAQKSCCLHILLAVPSQQRQVEDERNPVSVDKEERSQKSVDGGFGDDVCVQAVTEIDGVDVVAGAILACAQERVPSKARTTLAAPTASEYAVCSPFQIAVHDGEEHLQKQVDSIYQYRQQVQPCFARHCGSIVRRVALPWMVEET
jgi:hypothetical protein